MTATAVKERPILFSGPMVRAILAGKKTMTRRIVNQQHCEGIETDDDGKFSFMHSPTCGGYCDYACAAAGEVIDGHIGWTRWGSNPNEWGRLWVRETWAPMQEFRPIANPEKYDNKPAWYKADCDRPMWAGDKWKPSIFMPRECCRIVLQITGIRVERLRQITPADAVREGFSPTMRNEVPAVSRFRELWDELNGSGAYESNPWVWVVSFKRIETCA